jgi:twitching motility protein PilT
MSSLTALVEAAYAAGASDLHLEAGLPPAFRVNGKLRVQASAMSGAAVKAMAREVAGADGWTRFLGSRSLDLSRSLAGVRCRINILQSRRGVGMAVRLLAGYVPTLDRLNLHPSIKELCKLPHGLVLVSGPTGSGKSSTIAAMVQEINTTEAQHILMLEAPVEHWMRPQKAYIRQREVGRDTPSFEHGLLDALREDPDVIVVGEMRRPETMRLTLDAAETGHLVFTTVHSSSVAEAIHRVVAAFPADAQPAVRAQLADCLAAVVCQRLVMNDELGIRVPELELLRVGQAARSVIRQDTLSQMSTVLETGAAEGSYTRERYRRWLAGRDRFHVASRKAPGKPPNPEMEGDDLPALAPRAVSAPSASGTSTPRAPAPSDGVFVLDDDATDTASILSELLGS